MAYTKSDYERFIKNQEELIGLYNKAITSLQNVKTYNDKAISDRNLALKDMEKIEFNHIDLIITYLKTCGDGINDKADAAITECNNLIDGCNNAISYYKKKIAELEPHGTEPPPDVTDDGANDPTPTPTPQPTPAPQPTPPPSQG